MRLLKRVLVTTAASVALLAPAAIAQASTTTGPASPQTVTMPMPQAGVASPAYTSQNNHDLNVALGYYTRSTGGYIDTSTANGTPINMTYYGTVSSSKPFGFLDSEYNGYAYYVIVDRANGYCFGINAGQNNAIEETNNNCGGAGGQYETYWIAAPAQNGQSGRFTLVNVSQSEQYGQSLAMTCYNSAPTRCSDNYKGANGNANGQTFYLANPS